MKIFYIHLIERSYADNQREEGEYILYGDLIRKYGHPIIISIEDKGYVTKGIIDCDRDVEKEILNLDKTIKKTDDGLVVRGKKRIMEVVKFLLSKYPKKIINLTKTITSWSTNIAGKSVYESLYISRIPFTLTIVHTYKSLYNEHHKEEKKQAKQGYLKIAREFI